MRYMIDISKSEVRYLVSKGVPFGTNGISHSVGSYRKYYLAETHKNIELVNAYRQKQIK